MDAWQNSVESRLNSLDARLGRLEDKIDRNYRQIWVCVVILGLLIVGSFAWMTNVLFTFQSNIAELTNLLTSTMEAPSEPQQEKFQRPSKRIPDVQL